MLKNDTLKNGTPRIGLYGSAPPPPAKLRLHILCKNKHFSTANTISPNSKRKTFSCSLTIILFNHLLGLLIRFNFSVPRGFSCQPCNLVVFFSSSVLGPGYTDIFSNRSVFISLRFQIDPLWIAYSNVCFFVIVLIVSV